jgi:hypothetical protein
MPLPDDLLHGHMPRKDFSGPLLSQEDNGLSNPTLSFLVEMFYRHHPSDLISFGLNFM